MLHTIWVLNIISFYFHHTLKCYLKNPKHCSVKMKACILTVSLNHIFFASSHLSAGSSWTVTTVKLNYTVSGMKTHSMTIYLPPPLFLCITSPKELCPQNDNVILAVTHTIAFQPCKKESLGESLGVSVICFLMCQWILTSTSQNHKNFDFSP